MGNTDGDIKNEAKYKLNYSQHKTKQKSNKHVSTAVQTDEFWRNILTVYISFRSQSN